MTVACTHGSNIIDKIVLKCNGGDAIFIGEDRGRLKERLEGRGAVEHGHWIVAAFCRGVVV